MIEYLSRHNVSIFIKMGFILQWRAVSPLDSNTFDMEILSQQGNNHRHITDNNEYCSADLNFKKDASVLNPKRYQHEQL